MILTRYAFNEHPDSSERWKVAEFNVDQVTLFVGRNGTGKSRLLNTVGALSAMIAGKREIAASVATWEVGFDDGGRKFDYRLETGSGEVLKETLHIDGKLYIQRGSGGEGEMLSEGVGEQLKFKIPEARLAAARADEIQYSYLAPLQKWAESLKKYTFGSDFGRTTLFAATPSDSEAAKEAAIASRDKPENVVAIYHDGYVRFGEAFDAAILRDFCSVGYDCSEVFTSPLGVSAHQLPPDIQHRMPMMIAVRERDLETFTTQMEMSNGMFRALALIINVQHLIFSGQSSAILVDDIGEGLDYQRSTALIKLLIERCETHSIQLLMTTNDRFVMNEVDLRHWHVINRTGHDVNILDYENSKEIFDRFRFLGLSNFDFFSREAYLGNLH